MEKNIFTIEQQKVIAEAFSRFYSVSDVDTDREETPRVQVIVRTHDMFRFLAIGAAEGDFISSERISDFGEHAGAVVRLFETLTDDILYSAGVTYYTVAEQIRNMPVLPERK